MEIDRQALIAVTLLMAANHGTWDQKATSLSAGTREDLTPACTVDQEEDYLLIYSLMHKFTTQQFRHSLIKSPELMVSLELIPDLMQSQLCATVQQASTHSLEFKTAHIWKW